MAYHSKTSGIYHIYQKCSVGNNIEKDNRRNGSGNKALCSVCKDIKNGKRSR